MSQFLFRHFVAFVSVKVPSGRQQQVAPEQSFLLHLSRQRSLSTIPSGASVEPLSSNISGWMVKVETPRERRWLWSSGSDSV